MSDAARQEAERRYMPPGRPALVGEQCLADGFVDGAAWQREQPVEVTSAMVETIARAVDDTQDIRMPRGTIHAALVEALNGGTE